MEEIERDWKEMEEVRRKLEMGEALLEFFERHVEGEGMERDSMQLAPRTLIGSPNTSLSRLPKKKL